MFYSSIMSFTQFELARIFIWVELSQPQLTRARLVCSPRCGMVSYLNVYIFKFCSEFKKLFPFSKNIVVYKRFSCLKNVHAQNYSKIQKRFMFSKNVFYYLIRFTFQKMLTFFLEKLLFWSFKKASDLSLLMTSLGSELPNSHEI